ncbi:hypothetical protein HG536_0D03200 [Torulaspora globosa]|uniref:RING-type E3 ubiquitin transferase n=1 Tax=Torulaspora globosa TaxID=48254 RepID=A0A7G3ZH12_9SACH|nr:uncharacterized protein HG536_0D03200 [Torulaspora globosa]QLL32798.1 hypothetical protein HG536_0D03200 [Torulaspora globosa]
MSNSIAVSSAGAQMSSSSGSNTNSTARVTSGNQGSSGGSGSGGGSQRRRSSGLGSLLNTFGIRQNASSNSNGNGTGAEGSNGRVEQGEAVGRMPEVNFVQIKSPAQAHTHPRCGQQDLGAQQLPIAISLLPQRESGGACPGEQQRGAASASTSPLGGLAAISHQQMYPVAVNAPIADIDPLNPEGYTTQGNTDDNSNGSSGNAPGGAAAGAVGQQGTSENIASLKNLRHYIYAADQPNVDELLNLDLPRNVAAPEPVDRETVEQRKDKNGLFSIRLTPFIDGSFSTSPGLAFDPVIRTAGPGSQLVIGRYTERVREAIAKIPEQYHPVVFKSKVVSRTHGCFKVDGQGNWYIRDVRSSSGTFLNHQRLAPASTLSKDTPIHDGDILQLGMDFRGGTEEIYRCVKIRVELNRSWKRRANAFNKEALQRIRNLQKLTMGIEEEDCSICLSKIKPCQAMFISPCSHCWHFQCIRRLVMTSYPQFVCPNCRLTCDLEASLENSDSETESDDESEGGQLVDEMGVLLEDPKDINMN